MVLVIRMKELYEKKILIVDDEQALCQMVQDILSGAGFRRLRTAATCAEAMRASADWQPDAVLLDVTLPDGDGFTLFERLRGQREIPVLFLSARDEDDSRLTGLGLGADDYITKPFLPRELVLRLTAVLRRTYAARSEPAPAMATFGGARVDWGNGEVVRDSARSTLTAKEYALLKKLYENRGNIVTIDALCLAVWGENGGIGYDNTLMVHIRRLREKIEQSPSHPQWLVTVRGLGYKLERDEP
jgi:DNA-binding response OmpR family regulator